MLSSSCYHLTDLWLFLGEVLGVWSLSSLRIDLGEADGDLARLRLDDIAVGVLSPVTLLGVVGVLSPVTLLGDVGVLSPVTLLGDVGVVPAEGDLRS